MRVGAFGFLVVGLAIVAFVPVAAGGVFSSSFTVAEPRSGDSGLYTPSSIVVDGEAEDSDGLKFAFELGAWTTRLDAYGVEREVVPFKTYAVAEDQALELPWTSWVYARGSPALVSEVNPPDFLDVEVEMATFANRHHDPWGPECFFLSGLQGETVREGAKVPLGEFCGADLSVVAEEHRVEISVEVAEVVTLEEGGQGARFLIMAEAPEGELVMDVWYKEEIPYPVEVNLEAWVSPVAGSANASEEVSLMGANPFVPWFQALGEDEESPQGESGGAVEASILLERFHRGSDGVVPDAGLPSWPASNKRLVFEQDTRWGPPGGEGGLPYAKEEAVDAILNDPTLLAFQEWWDASPSARAYETHFEETVTRTERSYAWIFHVVREDGEAYRLVSERTVELRAPGEPLIEAPVPVTENRANSYQAEARPALEAFPGSLPTVPSLTDAWAMHDPDTHEEHRANAFSWTHPLTGQGEQPIEVGWKDPGDGDASVNFFDWGETYSLIEVHPEDGALLEHERMNVQTMGSWLGAPIGGGSSPEWSDRPFVGASDGPAALDAPVVLGIATASTLALLAVLVIKLGVGIPLYSRLTRAELLDHPTRKRVYEALEASPGQSLAALAQAADCSASTVRYHLDRLEREGLVASAGHRGSRRWFPQGTMGQAAMEAHTVLSIGDTADAFQAIQDNPGASLSEVATALGTTPPAAHKIVDRLIDAGLVEKKRDGRSIALHPAKTVENVRSA